MGSYFNGCDGEGAFCGGPSCNPAPVSCQEDNVSISLVRVVQLQESSLVCVLNLTFLPSPGQSQHHILCRSRPEPFDLNVRFFRYNDPSGNSRVGCCVGPENVYMSVLL